MILKGKVVGQMAEGERASIRIQLPDGETFFRTLGVFVAMQEAEHWPLGMPVTVTVEKGESDDET